MASPALSPRQFQYLLLAYGGVLIGHVTWLPWWMAPLLLTVVALRGWQRKSYRVAWPGWVRIPLLFGLIALVVAEFGNPLARQAGTAMLLGLVCLKLVESERRRDGYVVAVVCFFLISVQFLFEQGLAITLYMAVPSLFLFICLNQLATSAEGRSGLKEMGFAWRELALLLLFALPLTAFLFLSVPRLSEPLWGTRDNRYQGRTGLGEEMSPGSITELLGDDTAVFRVSFDGPPPPTTAMYWRGPVLWRYDGVTWTSNLEFLVSIDGYERGPRQAPVDALRYTVTMEPSERRWVFGLEQVQGFPQDVGKTLDDQLLRAKPITSVLQYQAASTLSDVSPLRNFPNQQRQWASRLPPGLNPRTRELGEALAREHEGNVDAIVNAALRRFRTDGFSYTLGPPPLLGQHRMDEFLFETKAGFCEHYASAFVVLMRAAGVPARVVTGYQGAYFNVGGGYFTVRNSDAHAWAEVLVPEVGWVRVDPTAAVAPERIQLGMDGFADAGLMPDWDWLRGARDRIDQLQNWWNQVVIRFDATRQQQALAQIGIDAQDWRQVGAWFAGGFALIALISGLFYLWPRAGQRLDPAARRYQRLLREVERLGFRCEPAEAPRDFAARVAAARPELKASLDAATEAYLRLRYAAPDTNPDALYAQLDAARASLRLQSRRRT